MFNIGERAVCVDNSFRPTNLPKDVKDLNLLKKGKIYHIDEIVAAGNGILLTEIESIPYYANRFRPIIKRETDISAFKKLLNPKNHKELCDNHD
jgi:hypothetical protein